MKFYNMLMTGRTHDLFALTCLVIVAAYTQPSIPNTVTLIGCIVASQLGALFPDIDQPTASFWDNMRIFRFLGKFFSKAVGGHRGLTHSIIGMVIVSFGASIILSIIHPLISAVDYDLTLASFVIGLMSHVFIDGFTKDGVPLFLPLGIKVGFPPIRALRISTGKLVEKSFVFPFLLVLITAIIKLEYSYFNTIL